MFTTLIFLFVLISVSSNTFSGIDADIIEITRNIDGGIDTQFGSNLKSISSQQKTTKGVNFVAAEPSYKMWNLRKDAPLQNSFHQQAIPTVSLSFYYSGGTQYWTVPVGVTGIQVDLSGGSGGSDAGFIGGLGGRVLTNLAVTPGQTYAITIGGVGASRDSYAVGITASGVRAGGFNGGGCSGATAGSGGGGASDIRSSVNGGLSSRLIVAGGGGGGCYLCRSHGGNAGGFDSTGNGAGSTVVGCIPNPIPPTGGNQVSGGHFGTDGFGSSLGLSGVNETAQYHLFV